MNLKTITGPTMAHALAAVKQELGPHAVVLHTRQLKRGGILGIGARTVVEITAADGRELGRAKRKQAKQSPRAEAIARQRKRQRAAMAEAEVEPAPQPMAGDLIRQIYAQGQRQASAEAPLPPPQGAAITKPAQPLAAGPSTQATPTQPQPTDEPPVRVAPLPDQAHLVRELQEVKQLIGRAMHQGSAPAMPSPMPDSLVGHYLKLIEQEVAQELADRVVRDAQQSLEQSSTGGDAGLSGSDSRERSLDVVREMIRQHVPVVDGLSQALTATPDGRPRTMALIGPTGVGKTTTVAKLAATFKLKHDKNVGLITMDTYRIAAVEQLRSYADIIGVPLHVANTPDEVQRAVKKLDGVDVILIDSAGRAPRDAEKLAELRALLDAARPHEVHLVLSSTASQGVMMDAAECFAAIPSDRVIFTKLDEAVTAGVLINVAARLGKELSFLTTGQEVPHQIEPASTDRLVDLVLGHTDAIHAG